MINLDPSLMLMPEENAFQCLQLPKKTVIRKEPPTRFRLQPRKIYVVCIRIWKQPGNWASAGWGEAQALAGFAWRFMDSCWAVWIFIPQSTLLQVSALHWTPGRSRMTADKSLSVCSKAVLRHPGPAASQQVFSSWRQTRILRAFRYPSSSSFWCFRWTMSLLNILPVQLFEAW